MVFSRNKLICRVTECLQKSDGGCTVSDITEYLIDNFKYTPSPREVPWILKEIGAKRVFIATNITARWYLGAHD